MIKAVFFDLDGTLLDTSKDLGNALNAVRRQQGLTLLSESATRAQVSNGANALVKLGFGDNLSDQEHQQYRQALLDAYLENIAEYTVAFEGIEPLITEITRADLRWGIVTNKPAIYTQALMPHFEFASAPDAVICPDHVKARKPDPESLFLACTQTGVKPSETLYIGDHKRDIDAGIAAGMRTIAVGYGFTDTASCHLEWGADYTVDAATDIWPLIQTIMQDQAMAQDQSSTCEKAGSHSIAANVVGG